MKMQLKFYVAIQMSLDVCQCPNCKLNCIL